ncbi:MAG: MerR family transcriptional regulator, heat shock protein HspR [Solirubrobacterales bacterium]|nr:MerR family transcriptional regulator, heat shock protein HspR [Solirubrobacterales bacterium]
MSSGSDSSGPGRRRAAEESQIAAGRGVFMISIAAELAGMHPQTLRMYEARGLIRPQRSPKQTRLYSQRDVEMLRRIQQMTSEEGLNLAGVELVLEMERKVEQMRAEIGRMRQRAEQMEREMAAEMERMRRSLRTEIVPYGAYEPDQLIPGSSKRSKQRVQIPVDRPRRKRA